MIVKGCLEVGPILRVKLIEDAMHNAPVRHGESVFGSDVFQ